MTEISYGLHGKKSYQQVLEFLDNIQQNISSKRIEMKVPFGSLAYFKGNAIVNKQEAKEHHNIDNTEDDGDTRRIITVLLGDNLFIELSVKDAKEICLERITKVDSRLKQLKEQGDDATREELVKLAVNSNNSGTQLLFLANGNMVPSSSNVLYNEEGLRFVDIQEKYAPPANASPSPSDAGTTTITSNNASSDKPLSKSNSVLKKSSSFSSKKPVDMIMEPSLDASKLDDFDKNLLDKLNKMSMEPAILEEDPRFENSFNSNTGSSGTAAVISDVAEDGVRARKPPPRKLEKKVSFSERFTAIDPLIPKPDEVAFMFPTESKRVSFSEKVTEIHSGNISDEDTIESTTINTVQQQHVTAAQLINSSDSKVKPKSTSVKVVQEDPYLSPEEEDDDDELADEDEEDAPKTDETYSSTEEDDEESDSIVMKINVKENDELPSQDEGDYDSFLLGRQLSKEYNEKRERMIQTGSLKSGENNDVENIMKEDPVSIIKQMYSNTCVLSPDIVRYIRRSSSSEKTHHLNNPATLAQQEQTVFIKSQRRLSTETKPSSTSNHGTGNSNTMMTNFKPNLSKGRVVSPQEEISTTTASESEPSSSHIEEKVSLFKLRRQQQQHEK